MRKVFTACFLAVCVSSSAMPDEKRTAADTADAIDAIFQNTWNSEAVTPSPRSGDSEYLRRLYLDLAGRIPSVAEVREFLESSEAQKRTLVVDEILDSPAFVRNFTTVWRSALIPQANDQAQFRGLIPGFEAWLWEHLSKDTPYDQIARAIITAELNANNGPALVSATSPDAFFVVRELKPENLASGTARAFLGVRLDCAQCHDHPFDKWKQQQFWNMAAFYSGFARPENEDDNPTMMRNMTENVENRSIKIPGTEEVVPAVFLTGAQPDWKEDSATTPRTVLADWIVNDKNPYFARMAVNRLWARMFGRGIVDPVDDFSENNPPSHPEVLDLLAKEFISSGYDPRHIIRVIVATEVYQLSSEQTDESQRDAVHFARAALRGLTPEQLFDSLAEAVGFYQPFRSENPFVVETNTPRALFLNLFRDNSESAVNKETTILQALAMMNGEFIDNATSLDNGQTLRAIIEFPAMTEAQKLNTLFLASVSRMPTAAESAQFGEYLKTGGPTKDVKNALSDVFWVLLNSSEFLLNH